MRELKTLMEVAQVMDEGRAVYFRHRSNESTTPIEQTTTDSIYSLGTYAYFIDDASEPKQIVERTMYRAVLQGLAGTVWTESEITDKPRANGRVSGDGTAIIGYEIVTVYCEE